MVSAGAIASNPSRRPELHFQSRLVLEFAGYFCGHHLTMGLLDVKRPGPVLSVCSREILVPADGIYPALPIMRNIIHHNSHTLGSLW